MQPNECNQTNATNRMQPTEQNQPNVTNWTQPIEYIVTVTVQPNQTKPNRKQPTERKQPNAAPSQGIQSFRVGPDVALPAI